MAKPMTMPPKAKKIRIWLWVITLSFIALFFTMKYTVMGKAHIISGLVNNCAQSAPAGSGWKQDLAKYGYSGDTSWLPQPYCECVLIPAFEPMSETDIRRFGQLPAEERLMKLGGGEVMQQRHEQCLQKFATPKS